MLTDLVERRTKFEQLHTRLAKVRSDKAKAKSGWKLGCTKRTLF